MKLYLETFSSNEHWKPAAPIIVVELAPEELERIKKARHALVKLSNDERLNVSEIVLWSNPVDSWTKGFDEDGTPWEPGEDDDVGTELQETVVSEDSFFFSAYVDNCPDRLTTGRVDFEGSGSFEDRAVPPWQNVPGEQTPGEPA